MYIRAIEIGESTLGPFHADLAVRLYHRATLLEKQVRNKTSREMQFGSLQEICFWSRNESINMLHNVYLQGKYDDADPLYARCINIGDEALHRDHPDQVERVKSRARMLLKQVRYHLLSLSPFLSLSHTHPMSSCERLCVKTLRAFGGSIH